MRPENLLAIPLLAAVLCAQGPDRPPERPVDPYTGGEAQRMAAAGVIRYAPFPLGQYHDTDDVDALVPPGTFLWLETEHFRIGSSLPAYGRTPDRDQQKKLRAELEALQGALPNVDPSDLTLDRWLRLHLFARRCEAVYADFRDRLGLQDDDFPQRQSEVRRGTAFLGVGPYLGKPDKYVVLLGGRAEHFQAYTQRFLGSRWEWPQRADLGVRSGLFFGTSVDLGGQLGDDTALHAHVVYNVVHNLIDGFRHFLHETPVWFKTGLAQSYLRRIDPRYPNYDRPPRGEPDMRNQWQWERIVPKLVASVAVTPMAEMASWKDYGPFSFEDYVVAWSRVEFLLTRGDRAFARFVYEFKDPLTLGHSTPSWSAVLAQQQTALRDAYGYTSWEQLDAEWRAWVVAQDSGSVGSARPETTRRRRR
ncbi:MAG: hypothetical protein IPM29_23750 [Planctomycetes bacterium]|nr:hypothetical protein [Planctomycetota bacterium]